MENELKFSTTKKRANVLPQLHSCYHSNNNNNNINNNEVYLIF